MNCAVAGEWGQAHTYAVQALAVRESLDRAMILLDFSRQYETEAFLRGGDESQAREAMQRLGERLGPSPRFRIPYLQSLAVPAAGEGPGQRATARFRTAAGLAPGMCLPATE